MNISNTKETLRNSTASDVKAFLESGGVITGVPSVKKRGKGGRCSGVQKRDFRSRMTIPTGVKSNWSWVTV